MSKKDELMDVLSLSRSFNNEIQQFNQVTSDDSRDLKSTLIDPKKAAAELVIAVAREEANGPPQPPAAPPPPVSVQTLDGYSVAGPMGLIPMPEGMESPQNVMPATPTPTPDVSVIPSGQPETQKLIQSPRKASDTGQLELTLDCATIKDFANPLDYFEEKYNRMEEKFDVINAKLTELIRRTAPKPTRVRKPKNQPSIVSKQTPLTVDQP